MYASPTKTVVTVDSSTSPRGTDEIPPIASPAKRSVRFNFDDEYKTEEYDSVKERVTAIDADYHNLRGKLNDIKTEINYETTRKVLKELSPIKGLKVLTHSLTYS